MVELLFGGCESYTSSLSNCRRGAKIFFFSYIYDVRAYLYFDVFFMLLLEHIYSYFHAAPFSNITSTSLRGTPATESRLNSITRYIMSIF